SSFNGGRDAYVAQIISLNSVSTPPFNITGSSGDDTVIVTRTGDTITANVNGVITSRQLSNISMINITTGDGKDTITVDDDVIGVTIDSGNGDDRIIGSDNSDFIRAGYRLSFGDTENDYVVANEGNDTVSGDDGNDTITGSAGKDKLYGENGEDRINGGKGNDTIFGGSGDDRMYGNEDNDSIDGGGNVDRAWGGVGNDTIIGGGSNDKLYGEDGNDRFFGNAGADLISGGSGTDAAKDEDDENLYSSIEVYF
ncbi:MAG TPA: calcium-binding protein, partial [Tepidisphaeraceae bacterium]|nr:calcium-binding protein [Tepidisphaeraceae bacterium]